MRFPFITRAHHDEVVSLLKDRIDRLEQENRKLLDHYAVLSHNRAIFDPAPTPAPAATQASEVVPETEDRHLRDVREAVASGRKSVLAIANYITAKNQREYDAKAPHSSLSTADDHVADFDRSVNEAAAKEQA